jgi:hypothetical protein
VAVRDAERTKPREFADKIAEIARMARSASQPARRQTCLASHLALLMLLALTRAGRTVAGNARRPHAADDDEAGESVLRGEQRQLGGDWEDAKKPDP